MFELPKTIRIDDEEYSIRNDGDFRTVLDCLEALQDNELPKKERVIASLIIFYDALYYNDEDECNLFEVFNTQDKLEKAVSEMYTFINCGKKDSLGSNVNYKLMDWKQDNHLIAAAINNVAHIEIRDVAYMHWWTFMGHYISIGDSTFSHIVGIRSKIMEGKKLEDHEKEFRAKNPDYFVWDSQTLEQKELQEEALALWNSGV